MQKVLHTFDILSTINNYLTFNDIKNVALICKNIKIKYDKRVLIKYEENINTFNLTNIIICKTTFTKSYPHVESLFCLSKYTVDVLKHFPNLTYLDGGPFCNFTRVKSFKLPKLKTYVNISLEERCNQYVMSNKKHALTRNAFSNLDNYKNVTRLYCDCSPSTTLFKLINNNAIDITNLVKLSNLTHLNFGNIDYVDDKALFSLIHLTNLTYLNCGYISIGDSIMSRLTTLTHLYCRNNRSITGDGVSKLVNLKALGYSTCYRLIKIDDVLHLKNLVALFAEDHHIKEEHINQLPNLKILYSYLSSTDIKKFIKNTTLIECAYIIIRIHNSDTLTAVLFDILNLEPPV